MRIAREGYPWIVGALIVFLGFYLLGWIWVSGFAILLALAFIGFFRDPERIPPAGNGLVLSPADGRIVGIHDLEVEKKLNEYGTRVSIFLSPLDVHINRAPIRGQVERVVYRPGKFFAAYRDKASEDNEQNSLIMVDPKGRRLSVVQIAGAMARRIVCSVKEGDSLEKGQRFGLIMFGSRVDLIMPPGSIMEVTEGQRVKGGETVIGRLS